jgi:hypothetical protein
MASYGYQSILRAWSPHSGIILIEVFNLCLRRTIIQGKKIRRQDFAKAVFLVALQQWESYP